MYIIYGFFLNEFIQVQITKTKLIWIPFQPKIKGVKWWYQLPYVKTYSIITHEPDESVNYTKITLDKYRYANGIPKNYTTQSIIYVTLMEDIFLQRRMIVKNDTVIRLLPFAKATFRDRLKETVLSYDEMVYIIQFWGMFGHNIHDYLCGLMFAPKELQERGFIVLKPPGASKATLDIARSIGLNVTFAVLPDEKKHQIFVKKLWVINSLELGHGYASGGFQRIRALVFQMEQYKKIKPERYVVLNRPRRSRRFFDDANKLVRILNENTTIEKGCKWVRDDNSYGVPIQDIIKYWMSLKVLVTVQGSGIYNGIFMHEKTGMCLLFSNNVDRPNMHLCTHLHVFMIGVIHPGRPILSYKAYPTNYTQMVKYTQRVVDAVENGAWTNLEGLRGFINASYPVTNATDFLYNYKEFLKHW